MCADKARAVSYRHTANLGLLKIPLPAGRSLVETSGRSRIPCLPLSAGATLAVDAGRRGRRPLQDDACRGGCPHPPVSSPHPPPSKAQADLEGQSFRQAPRNFHQSGNRGARPAQGNGPARAGRRLPCFSQHTFRTAPVHKPTCAQVQVRRYAFFSFGPSTARFLFVKNKKKMGGGLPD